MGRESSISQEQVTSAIAEIQSEGGKPTLRNVRDRLGSGSMGTIAKLMQSSKVATSTAELVLPPALTRSILDFMSAELQAVRLPMELSLAELQNLYAELAGDNDRQAEAYEALSTELEAEKAAKAVIEGKSGQLLTEVFDLKEEAARERSAAEAARTELAKAVLRLEAMPRLEADLLAVRAELEKERAARTVAAQSAAVLAAQKIDLEARVVHFKEVSQHAEKLTSQLADLRVKAQASASRVEQLTAQLEDSRATAKSVEVRTGQLEAQLQVAQNDAKVALEAAAVLRGKVGQLEASKIEVSK